MPRLTREYNTKFKTKSTWFVDDSDFEDMIQSNKDIEIEGHTFEVRNPRSEKAYVHSFAINVSVKPVSQYKRAKIEYDDDLCEELYEQGFRLDSNSDINDYDMDVTYEQFEEWIKDNHCAEYLNYQKDLEYQLYNRDKVTMEDLSPFLIQKDEPIDNPFANYVKEHNNFMKDCPYTYYCWDSNYNDYCILHLITGESKYNPWTKDTQTIVYGVQKYCYNQETKKVNKIFIFGKPHVEIFKGKDDENVVICCESFVKAWTLYRTMKKKYTVITTHSKYIRDNDLRFINENFKNYSLCIFCDTDEESSEITNEVRAKYSYYPENNRNLRDIHGVQGNTSGMDINDSIRNATKMIRKYIDSRELLIETKKKYGLI